MKRLIFTLAMLAFGGGAALADPIEGLWKTQPDKGAYAYVQIKPCGANFCGDIARTFKDGTEYKASTIGRQIVIDMAPQGGGKYKGKVWRPANNKIYLGKITLNGDQMALAGCVAGGLFCKSQQWVRLK